MMDYALRTLSGHALSAAEIRTKLHRRAAEPGDVEEIVGKLKEAGYLDDRRFAESYATARLENQGFGKMRVLRDLRQRRVAGAVASRAVEQTFAGTDETALVEQFLARKYRNVVLAEYLSEDKHLLSAYRRLRLAGFSAGTSIRVLKRYAAAAEALEEAADEGPLQDD